MAKESIQAIKEALLTVTDATDERLAGEKMNVQECNKRSNNGNVAS